MKRITSLFLLFYCVQLLGEERVNMRGLQDGPYGDGFTVAKIYKSELELGFGLKSSPGEARSKESNRILSGNSDVIKVTGAFGFHLNNISKFHSFASFNLHTSEYSTNQGRFYKDTIETGVLEVGAGPSFTNGPIFFGGSVSALIFLKEIREVEWEEQKVTHTKSQAAIPIMRLFSGYNFGEAQLNFGLRIYNRQKVTKTLEVAGAPSFTVDRTRSMPGMAWTDFSFQASKTVKLSLGLTGYSRDQSSERVDEANLGMSNSFEASPELREQSHTVFSFGGVYKANRNFSLLSSVHYISPSYSKTEYASPVRENLGGYKVIVGSTASMDAMIVNFNAGYMIPISEKFTVDNAVANTWAELGDNVSMEQSQWHLSLSGSFPF
ncbi:MAG: DUF3187 family protein [Oligoflexales bacterium]|nr:DUF3187 family protein [Oligoflexales bacterium]